MYRIGPEEAIYALASSTITLTAYTIFLAALYNYAIAKITGGIKIELE